MLDYIRANIKIIRNGLRNDIPEPVRRQTIKKIVISLGFLVLLILMGVMSNYERVTYYVMGIGITLAYIASVVWIEIKIVFDGYLTLSCKCIDIESTGFNKIKTRSQILVLRHEDIAYRLIDTAGKVKVKVGNELIIYLPNDVKCYKFVNGAYVINSYYCVEITSALVD